MKQFLISAFILLVASIGIFAANDKWEGTSVEFSHGRLKVSENKRFLIFEDGTPFFYLGDTGWELFHRLNKDDAEKYLENRRSKGFTVIQAVALAELDGLNTPNAEGNRPLINNDPLKPNEAYFSHVDWVIKKAEEKGIFIGLLPTWGDKVDKQWGVGPARHNWYDVLDLPGASQLIHARRLMESKPFVSRIPDQSMIAPDYFPETDYVVATRGNGYAFVYFPTGWAATIILSKINAEMSNASWFNPRTGEFTFIEKIKGDTSKKFTPPSSGRGNDLILVLDDASVKQINKISK